MTTEAPIDFGAMSFEDLEGNLGYYDDEIMTARAEGRHSDAEGWRQEMVPFAVEMLKRSMALLGPEIDRAELDDEIVRTVSAIRQRSPELWDMVKHLPTAWDRVEGILLLLASQEGVLPNSLRN